MAKIVLTPLTSMTSTSAISAIHDVIQRKIHEKGVVRAVKRITFVISNEDMDGINRIMNSLENKGAMKVKFLLCY